MYKKIILALSLEHGYSTRALEVARRLRAEDGVIQAVHVYEQPSSNVGAYLDEEILAMAYAEARARLKERVANAPDVEPVMLKGHSGMTIAEYAASSGADLIVVGSHKPGLRDYFLGSTAARIVRHAPCSVHVLRDAD
ncbi:universal stress protein [Jhaorihella thermophila]|uniref:Nucleotide-binding universal stress protein, UspA family n=1 Tax=Jhaorihella thermophila TaxID=488547 RepID=A0A1H5UGW5_9RHOB|nr:universal stress protein [Jhaorihella thermophila]SEF74259.1 Nucleotide-binding universal stress protein, UspA family [Jhaorihella thermophila]